MLIQLCYDKEFLEFLVLINLEYLLSIGYSAKYGHW